MPHWLGILMNPLFLIAAVVIIGGSLVALRTSKQQMKHKLTSFTPQKVQLTSDQPTVTFADVAGLDEVVAELKEVKDYLTNPDRFKALGAQLPRGMLLFGPPGLTYVYFIYGNHYCFNVSCLPDGEAGGVLFRALEPISGIEQMAQARDISIDRTAIDHDLRNLTSGPGRLAEAFGITRERDNEKDLTNPKSDLFIVDDGFRPGRIEVTPRIGITKAAERPLRYIIVGNKFVSK